MSEMPWISKHNKLLCATKLSKKLYHCYESYQRCHSYKKYKIYRNIRYQRYCGYKYITGINVLQNE